MVRCGMRTMAAGKFKATCLAVMDEVQAKREPVVITKNGKPVAKLVPIDIQEDDPLAVFRFGQGKIIGDIVSPITPLEDWDELK
jgi:prevent-host-death family protein